VLDEGLRSGLFLAGMRRTGKTTFLRTDLVPELEAQGAVVIYVDLWSDTRASPAALVQAAVRQSLEQLGASGGATLAEAFRQVVDQTRGDVVLIVDEVQQAITSEEGHQMLLALKAARDATNPRPFPAARPRLAPRPGERTDGPAQPGLRRRHLPPLSAAGSGVRAPRAGAAAAGGG